MTTIVPTSTSTPGGSDIHPIEGSSGWDETKYLFIFFIYAFLVPFGCYTYPWRKYTRSFMLQRICRIVIVTTGFTTPFLMVVALPWGSTVISYWAVGCSLLLSAASVTSVFNGTDRLFEVLRQREEDLDGETVQGRLANTPY